MSNLGEVFAECRQAKRAAFVPFLTAGDPDLETTGQLLQALADTLDRDGAAWSTGEEIESIEPHTLTANGKQHTFDWVVGRWFKRWHVKDNPTGLSKSRWWVHIKYYLLSATLISSLFGILISGYFSAIPVLTRGLLFSLGRLQLWVFKGENQLTPVFTAFPNNVYCLPESLSEIRLQWTSLEY